MEDDDEVRADGQLSGGEGEGWMMVFDGLWKISLTGR